MTIKEIESLPLGADLWYREGKLSMPVYLARKTRDACGCVVVSNHKLLGRAQAQHWAVKPRSLRAVVRELGFADRFRSEGMKA
jgi:hypothetical protein